MVSLSVALYLVVRTLPRIVDEPVHDKRSILDGWTHSHIPEKIDTFLNGFLLKLLRKLKVFVLRIDNTLSKHLEKVKPEDNGKKSSIDFKEIAGNGSTVEKSDNATKI